MAVQGREHRDRRHRHPHSTAPTSWRRRRPAQLATRRYPTPGWLRRRWRWWPDHGAFGMEQGSVGRRENSPACWRTRDIGGPMRWPAPASCSGSVSTRLGVPFVDSFDGAGDCSRSRHGQAALAGSSAGCSWMHRSDPDVVIPPPPPRKRSGCAPPRRGSKPGQRQVPASHRRSAFRRPAAGGGAQT